MPPPSTQCAPAKDDTMSCHCTARGLMFHTSTIDFSYVMITQPDLSPRELWRSMECGALSLHRTDEACLCFCRLHLIRQVIGDEECRPKGAHNPGYQGIIKAWNAQRESEHCNVCILGTCREQTMGSARVEISERKDGRQQCAGNIDTYGRQMQMGLGVTSPCMQRSAQPCALV